MKSIVRRNLLTMGAFGLAGLATWLANPSSSQADETGTSLREFQGIQTWLNSQPLTLADLKGKVVGIHIWTLGCINCQRTLPRITQTYNKYAKQGFVLVGVHTPEFPYERDINNIQAAIKEHGILYPVAVDNQFATWKAYNNEYWPHLFIADKSGKIRFDHIGEGAYDEIDQTVQKLLKEA